MARHELLGGLVQVYKRGGRYWNCSASIDGRQFRLTTKEEDLAPAKEFAEDWYLGLRGKARAGLLKKEKTFGEAADQFEKEYEIITEGQRSKLWVEGHKLRIRLHLRPFFGDLGLSEVTPGKVQEYRMHRVTTSSTGKAPARSTMHDEIVTLRQVLKTAIRHNWLSHLPDLSPPYRTQGKIVHRPWFSPDEYKQLYTARRFLQEHAGSRAAIPASNQTRETSLVHELTHWAGAKHRLARDMGKRFGDHAYAAEELIAEIGAAFLCAELGITQETRADHAQYLAQWLELMKGDSRAIFAAAAKASEAADYLKRFSASVSCAA